MKSPIFLALDTKNVNEAIVSLLKDYLYGIKIGMEFFYANGKDGYRKIQELDLPIFLDLKLFDIPNTVYEAILSLSDISPNFLTVHASAGLDVLKKAREASLKTNTKLLGVTSLTSSSSNDIFEMVENCLISGIDGIICSGNENKQLREIFGNNFLIVNPGIRPAWAENNDQKRICTPVEAMSSGANYLVIGRPILNDNDPVSAIKRILEEIE